MKRKKRKGARRVPTEVALLAVQMASAAIYMQPGFKESESFKRFAASKAGKLLHDKEYKQLIDKLLSETHEELLRLNLVALTDNARQAITKDSRVLAKAALQQYIESIERSVPDDMRAEVLARMPFYQDARKILEAM